MKFLNYFDKDMNERISKEDLCDSIKTLDIFIPKDELASILAKISIYDYLHFEENALKINWKINKDEIVKAFHFLNPQKIGFAHRDKIKKAFLLLGEHLKAEKIYNLLKEYSKGNQVDNKN